MAAAFAVISLWPLKSGHPVRLWSAILSALFLAIALLRPSALRPANILWTKLGTLLHHLVSPIVMALLFYGVFTPMGWIARMLGKDLLRLHFDPQAPTYWIVRDPPGPDPKTMRAQF